MHNLFRLIDRFRRNRRGNIAMTFALAMLPIMAGIGCAVDYSQATRIRVKLQSAADAASVAAISQKSPGYIAAAAMNGNGSVAAAVTDAQNVFYGDIYGIPGYQSYNITPTATVTKTGVQLTSNVTFTATVPTNFMRVIGASYQTITVTGSSSSSGSLPPYLDFYLTLDVSGSMGEPSTPTEATRLQTISPDNYVQYPTGCTLACHFAQPPLNNLKTGACIDPAPNTPPNNPALTPTQKYPTGNYCLGYEISRVSQTAYAQLLLNHSGQLPAYKYTKATAPPTQVAQPTAFYSTSAAFPNDPVLTPVASCPTPGTDACIQLRLDAVGFALNATLAANGVDGLLALAQKKAVVTNQFRIGLYPFITDIDKNYAPLTSSISGSSTTPGTINYAAAKLATELDTNLNSTLGSGGTHIDNSLNSINNLIINVGTGNAPTNTQPYVFLVTDGAQDNQYKDVPDGSWHGSNHATVLNDLTNGQYANICQTLKNRGIIVSVLYIPYVKIFPVNTSFAGNEDTYANNNIPNIPPSLQGCASPPDAAGSYYYMASSPAEIQASLNAMFNHTLQTAHITN